MGMHAALAAAATLVSAAFALSTLERWLVRRKRHQLDWTISLAMFAAGSASLWWGASVGWDEWSFKSFFLFGAILNVPWLALGTLELLYGPMRKTTSTIALLSAFCTGLMLATPLVAAVPADVLPQGKDVFGIGPRIAAAVGSGVAAIVIFAGAILSAWRLWRVHRSGGNTRERRGGVSPRRLAVANVLIAIGTVILSAGGLLNSVVDEMDGFSISLVLGIAVIFVGFLATEAKPEPVEWKLELLRQEEQLQSSGHQNNEQQNADSNNGSGAHLSSPSFSESA